MSRRLRCADRRPGGGRCRLARRRRPAPRRPPATSSLVANPEVDGIDGVDAHGLIPSIAEGGRFVALIADDSANGTSVFLRDMSQPGVDPGRASPAAKWAGLPYDADSPGLSGRRPRPRLRLRGPCAQRRRHRLRPRPAAATDQQPDPRHLRLRPGRRKRSPWSRGAAARPATAAERRLEPAGDLPRRPLCRLRHRVQQPDRRQAHRRRHLRPRPEGQDDHPRLARDGAPGQAARRLRTDALLRGAQGRLRLVLRARIRPQRDNEISVRDTRRHKTTIASRASGAHGAIANDDCGEPAISANGRYVAFASKATNLVHGDDRKVEDVFVRDLKRSANDPRLARRRAARRRRDGRLLAALDLRRRPLRRLPVLRQQPRAARQRRRHRRLRQGPAHRAGLSRLAGRGRRAGQRRLGQPLDLTRRPLRRLQLQGDESEPAGHRSPDRRVQVPDLP